MTGIVDRIKKKYAVTGEKWDSYVPIFHFLGGLAGYAEKPFIGTVIKKIGLLDRPDKNFTQGRVINLSRELNEKAEQLNTVLPIQLVKKAIRESGHLYIMHKCICRDGNKCQDYPVDFGCLFIGEGSRVVMERGIARKATVEEALAHVDKAADLGLVCQALWVEAEKYFWGFEEGKVHRFLEICMCCPCCCLALNTFKKIPRTFGDRIQSIGWKASVSDACTGCGACVEHCPAQAASIVDGRAVIQDRCLGCGLCAAHCPVDALSMDLASPIKEDLKDYFWGFRPEL